MSTSTDWLTLSEAALELRCSRDTIRRMIERGDLAATRFGGRTIRIRRSDLEAAGRPVTSTAAYRKDRARYAGDLA